MGCLRFFVVAVKFFIRCRARIIRTLFKVKNFAEIGNFHYIYIMDSVKICLQTQKISV